MAKRSNVKARNDAARQQAFEILAAEIRASPSGEVVTSAQRLGTRVGRAPQTVSVWLGDWARSGRIARERLPGNRGIKVRLPAGVGEAAGAEASAAPVPATSSETASATGREANPATGVEAAQEATREARSEAASEAASEAGQEASEAADLEAKREAKSEAEPEAPPRKRRTPVRRSPKPEIALAAVPARTPSPVPARALTLVPERPLLAAAAPRRPRASLLGWVLRLFALAASALSVAMVAMHVAGTEDEDPFAWWSLLLASILVSLLKPVLGTVAERLYAQRSFFAATLASSVAFGALAYDATNLWAFRGSGLEDKAAAAQAAIEARARDKARLEALLAERTRLVETDPPRPLGVVAAAIERTSAERRCQPVRVSRRSKETAVPARCVQALADLDAERAKAARVEELARLIETASVRLEARPVQADAQGGAKAAAATINWISQGLFGLDLASPAGVATGWSLAFVLLIEIVAVAGFALAARIERVPGAARRAGS